MAKEKKSPVDETTVEETDMTSSESTEEIGEQVAEAPADTEVDAATAGSPEAGEESAEAKKPAKTDKTEQPKRAFSHSAKYREVSTHVDRTKAYSIDEALELIKKVAYTKFDGSVDFHANLTPGKKNEDVVRGTVVLPHGTGRERKVVIITEEMIEKIEKGWLNFDVAIATPDMMPKLAKLAKVLGPKGLMPNPKSGTVTTDPQKAAEELKGGRVEYKTDSLNNIHQAIGKVSWDAAKLKENFQTFVGALPKNRLKSVSIAPTMGPGIKVQL